MRSATLKKPRNGGNFRDRMCNCNTVTRDGITIAIWSGHPPRHPASVRTCSMWFPVHFRFLAHSLTTFGRWGCGERSDLSRSCGDLFFCGRAVCDCGAAGGCAICWLVSVLRNRQTPPPPRKGRKRGKSFARAICWPEPRPSSPERTYGRTSVCMFPRLRRDISPNMLALVPEPRPRAKTQYKRITFNHLCHSPGVRSKMKYLPR